MKIENSIVASRVVKQTRLNAGILHFFNNFAVVEFNEGIHIDLNTARNTINEMLKFYGQKPFGLIANRVNSYSIALLDINQVKSIVPNLVAYGVVSHNKAGRMNAKIESGFCKTQEISFDNLYECINTVYNRVKTNRSTKLA